MANAAKRMKVKKDKHNEAIRTMKGFVVVDEPVVEEKVDVVVDVDAGTVTGIDVVDDVTPTDDYTEDELNEMTKAELQDVAEELGLDTGGKKAELIERILNA